MDNKSSNHALLPAGLSDLLPEEAAKEAQVIGRLLGVFRSYGYDPVKPPLIEFEESMLADAGQALEHTMFRLVDPLSQRSLCVRSDITIQVARIAASRMRNLPRPLRLSYSGDILRVEGTQLRPERQFSQAGFELIGSESHYADVEAIVLAVESLLEVGVEGISVDLTLPLLVPIVCEDLGFDENVSSTARNLLDRKDLVSLEGIAPSSKNNILSILLKSVGPVDDALNALASANLSNRAKLVLDHAALVLSGVRASLPDLILTLDPSEYRGFEYHTGLGFTIFARNVRGELGRGGRYSIPNGESATGFSVYLDSVMRAITLHQPVKRILVSMKTSYASLRSLRAGGWQTVSSLLETNELSAEAARLRCNFVLLDDRPISILTGKEYSGVEDD